MTLRHVKLPELHIVVENLVVPALLLQQVVPSAGTPAIVVPVAMDYWGRKTK